MIASDTGRRILDAVDANFDAQLATTGTSLPGLTRQSIFPGKCYVEAWMDTRVPTTPTAFVRRRTSAVRRLRRALDARPPKLLSEGGKPAHDDVD